MTGHTWTNTASPVQTSGSVMAYNNAAVSTYSKPRTVAVLMNLQQAKAAISSPPAPQRSVSQQQQIQYVTPQLQFQSQPPSGSPGSRSRTIMSYGSAAEQVPASTSTVQNTTAGSPAVSNLSSSSTPAAAKAPLSEHMRNLLGMRSSSPVNDASSSSTNGNAVQSRSRPGMIRAAEQPRLQRAGSARTTRSMVNAALGSHASTAAAGAACDVSDDRLESSTASATAAQAAPLQRPPSRRSSQRVQPESASTVMITPARFASMFTPFAEPASSSCDQSAAPHTSHAAYDFYMYRSQPGGYITHRELLWLSLVLQ